jgi:hypothetical protein
MAAQLQAIPIIAPGFKGINSEDSPVALDPFYASVADNCVIDRFGRVAARKGYTAITTSASALGSGTIQHIDVFRKDDGTSVVFSAGDNKIFTGTTTLVDATPGSYTITGNNWVTVSLGGKFFFFQGGHEPLIYDNAVDGVEKFSDVSGSNTPTGRTDVNASVALAAFGRLWVANFADDKSTVYWSDLLTGKSFTGGSSGSIDLATVWPSGYDTIVNIAAHNNNLIIFGKDSILVYGGADDPSTMELTDTIKGLGLRCRCGVVNIGTDLLFMSYQGLRSLGRAIQEKSLPISDLSRSVKTELLEVLISEARPFRAVFSPENSFVLFTFRDSRVTYCFDIKGTLEDGSYRVTRWINWSIEAYCRDTDGTLYVGNGAGIGKYDGYTDNGDSYPVRYYSPNLDFGDASTLKMIKKIKAVLIGGSNQTAQIRWGYDFDGIFSGEIVGLNNTESALYGEAEYGLAEYSTGVSISVRVVNATRSGNTIIVGFEAQIDGAPLSIQQYIVYLLQGRLL